jgi:hypothetical protein
VERDDHSLSGVLTGGDSGDAEGIRGVRRQMALTPQRRNANDTSDLASKRKRRHRSVSSSSSSSSDESQRNSGLVASPEKTARYNLVTEDPSNWGHSMTKRLKEKENRIIHSFMSPQSKTPTSSPPGHSERDILVPARFLGRTRIGSRI